MDTLILFVLNIVLPRPVIVLYNHFRSFDSKVVNMVHKNKITMRTNTRLQCNKYINSTYSNWKRIKLNSVKGWNSKERTDVTFQYMHVLKNQLPYRKHGKVYKNKVLNLIIDACISQAHTYTVTTSQDKGKLPQWSWSQNVIGIQ